MFNFRKLFRKEPKVAFLHIPKTGGTYLKPMYGVLPDTRYLGHGVIADSLNQDFKNFPPAIGYKDKPIFTTKELKKYIIFTTVRNPFDWLVSYASHAGGWNPKYRDVDHYDYENANKDFEYLLKTIIDRDDVWPNRKLIHFAVFSYNSNLAVDWINRNESLDEDVSLLAKKADIIYTKQDKKRVGKRKDYREYYNDKLIDLVEKTWGRELKLFGYDFDGKVDGILQKDISQSTKESLSYNWDKDELIFNGELLK